MPAGLVIELCRCSGLLGTLAQAVVQTQSWNHDVTRPSRIFQSEIHEAEGEVGREGDSIYP